MVQWPRITHPLPSFIHTFINLCNMPASLLVSSQLMAKNMVQEFTPRCIPMLSLLLMKKVKHQTPWLDCHYTSLLVILAPNFQHALYNIPVTSILSPTIGIQDVGVSNSANEEHLVLIRRLADWPAASWHSIITHVYQESKTRAPSPEPDMMAVVIYRTMFWHFFCCEVNHARGSRESTGGEPVWHDRQI